MIWEILSLSRLQKTLQTDLLSGKHALKEKKKTKGQAEQLLQVSLRDQKT